MPTTLLLAHPDLKTQWHLCNQTNINFLKKKVTFNHSYKKKSYNDPWHVGISLHSPLSATTPRILTSLKFPMKINWPVEICHQLYFSDMFKHFVSLKMDKMLSKIPKLSHTSDILDIKRPKWRLTSDVAYKRFKWFLLETL